ncbi:MAG: SDR family oxidoreductase [Chloroflexota bacterium]|nr:SDR family oxidoreductase [Chloroflexota bacterium]
MDKLKDQVAAVTGASSGIGRATARLLASEGAVMVLIARREKLLRELAEEISEQGGMAVAHPTDVTDPQAVEELFSKVREQFGGLDILVNSAGINSPRRRLADARLEDWTQVIEVNLTGVYLCVQGALPIMREQGSGTIINISSMAGKRTSIGAGAAYCASKHGLGSLTRSINLEERRRGIRACELCPGEVNTPIMDDRPYPPSPESRQQMLQPEDIAQAALFVAILPQRAMVEELHITPTTPRRRSSEELRALGIAITPRS